MALEKVMLYHDSKENGEITKMIIWYESDTCHVEDVFTKVVKTFPINKLYDFLRAKKSLSELTDDEILYWTNEVNNRLSFESFVNS